MNEVAAPGANNGLGLVTADAVRVGIILKGIEMPMNPPTVWIFCGANAKFPSGVFNSQDEARQWIRRHRLTGTLTEYPVGVGVYEWAIHEGCFTPSKPEHREADFIGRFSSASQNHEHFENGES